jgi:hypothetical protein
MSESDLGQAVREAIGGSSQARRRTYELLAQESLYVDAFPPSEPGGAVLLWTTIRGGRREMSVFTSMDSALTCNPDFDAYRVHAPASWIFLEAQRLGCAVVWIDSPQFEIQSPNFAALAKGLVPGDSPKVVPVQAQSQPAPVPPPFVPRTPVAQTPLPPEDAPRILPPSRAIPSEAQAYLPGALRGMPKISAAYFFDLLLPGEPPMLCLGLRIDLPSSEWNAFVDAIDRLDDIPGFPNGVAVYPLNDELLEMAREVGVKVL